MPTTGIVIALTRMCSWHLFVLRDNCKPNNISHPNTHIHIHRWSPLCLSPGRCIDLCGDRAEPPGLLLLKGVWCVCCVCECVCVCVCVFEIVHHTYIFTRYVSSKALPTVLKVIRFLIFGYFISSHLRSCTTAACADPPLRTCPAFRTFTTCATCGWASSPNGSTTPLP